jgi:hypothetical protein
MKNVDNVSINAMRILNNKNHKTSKYIYFTITILVLLFTAGFSTYATTQTSNNIDSNKNTVVTIARAEGTPSKETEITKCPNSNKVSENVPSKNTEITKCPNSNKISEDIPPKGTEITKCPNTSTIEENTIEEDNVEEDIVEENTVEENSEEYNTYNNDDYFENYDNYEDMVDESNIIAVDGVPSKGIEITKCPYCDDIYYNNEGDFSAYSSDDYITTDEFIDCGIINYNDNIFTYYSENVLPGNGLDVPGRYTDDEGYVCDEDNYVVLATPDEDIYPRYSTIELPTGRMGKFYDYCPEGSIDVYVNW